MKNNYKIIIIITIGVLAIILYIKYGIGIPCIFHETTGLYCPGCGMTRAISSLIQLNPHQAFRYNALIIFIPIIVIYNIYKIITKREIKIPNKIWYGILIIVVLYGILRNIPLFSYLAPTQLT